MHTLLEPEKDLMMKKGRKGRRKETGREELRGNRTMCLKIRHKSLIREAYTYRREFTHPEQCCW